MSFIEPDDYQVNILSQIKWKSKLALNYPATNSNSISVKFRIKIPTTKLRAALRWLLSNSACCVYCAAARNTEVMQCDKYNADVRSIEDER